MNPERRKLHRLQRLERVRAIAKQTAASEAARAESTLAQLQGLAARTRTLAAEYTSRSDSRDGADLRLLGHFARGLTGIQASTEADVDRARAMADRRQSELATAERRRAAVEDRASVAARDIARDRAAGASPTALGARKPVGTDLE